MDFAVTTSNALEGFGGVAIGTLLTESTFGLDDPTSHYPRLVASTDSEGSLCMSLPLVFD